MDSTGQWWEHTVRDLGNTEVAEQTFAKFRVFGQQVKLMRASWARVFLMRMRDQHNLKVTASLAAKGVATLPAVAPRRMASSR